MRWPIVSLRGVHIYTFVHTCISERHEKVIEDENPVVGRGLRLLKTTTVKCWLDLVFVVPSTHFT